MVAGGGNVKWDNIRMAGKIENDLSDFIESVDDMIGRHFAMDAEREIRSVLEGDAKRRQSVEEILYRLIRGSISHARHQVEGRKTGTMSFDVAVELMRSRGVMITRPGWNIFGAIRIDDDGEPGYWKLDNCDGGISGDGWPYKPTDEDLAASDWMLYQSPQENWVELEV
jgi:hypothetical protein